ncbi:MAG TPA: ROK family protein [Anaerolineaceae bacterium]|nr:ROK family protein [Anaerolineaceae bacterium]
MTERAFIGIDLGGTNVRAGLVDSAGTLRVWHDVPIEARQGPAAGLQRIITLIERVVAEGGFKPAAIGFGATGPVDHRHGIINNPYTLPTWEAVNVVAPLQAHFGVPVVLENDADVAALGEAWMGAGQGVDRLMVVTVGTGIGTAFILDGKIYRGAFANHPEGGHIPIDPNGPLCYCGANGCWEVLTSGNAIGAYARVQAVRKPTALLRMAGNDPEKIDSALVAAAAREGDPLALEIVDRSATYLALGLINLLHLFLPDCVVFTGGVMRSMDLFEPRMRAIIARHAIMNPIDQTPLRMAQLGQLAGLYGAARAAMAEVG